MISYKLPESFRNLFTLDDDVTLEIEMYNALSEPLLTHKEMTVVVNDLPVGNLRPSIDPTTCTVYSNINTLLDLVDVKACVFVVDYEIFNFMFFDLKLGIIHTLTTDSLSDILIHDTQPILNDPKETSHQHLRIIDENRMIVIEEDFAWTTLTRKKEIAATWWEVKDSKNPDERSNVFARNTKIDLTSEVVSVSFRRTYTGPDFDFLKCRAKPDSLLESYLDEGYTWNKLTRQPYKTVSF